MVICPQLPSLWPRHRHFQVFIPSFVFLLKEVVSLQQGKHPEQQTEPTPHSAVGSVSPGGFPWLTLHSAFCGCTALLLLPTVSLYHEILTQNHTPLLPVHNTKLFSPPLLLNLILATENIGGILLLVAAGWLSQRLSCSQWTLQNTSSWKPLHRHIPAWE